MPYPIRRLLIALRRLFHSISISPEPEVFSFTAAPCISLSPESMSRYSNSHLRLNAVSSGKTPWSALFIVAQMKRFDGSLSCSHSASGTSLSLRYCFMSSEALTGYSLSKSFVLSRSWKMSPKTAATIALLISSMMRRYGFEGSFIALTYSLMKGPGTYW